MYVLTTRLVEAVWIEDKFGCCESFGLDMGKRPLYLGGEGPATPQTHPSRGCVDSRLAKILIFSLLVTPRVQR